MKRTLLIASLVFVSTTLLAASATIDGSLDRNYRDGGTLINSRAVKGQWNYRGYVSAMAVVQGGDKVYIGGSFDTVDGKTAGRGLARLNQDGTLDTSFDTGVGFGAGEPESSNVPAILSIQAEPEVNGRAYVAGYFVTYRGRPSWSLVRINADGSKDETFAIGKGPDHWVQSMTLDPKTKKLYVLGLFKNFNGQAASRIVRLNEDGSTDKTFVLDPRLRDSKDLSVYKHGLLIARDGRLYLSCVMDDGKHRSAHRISRLNPDGSLDQTFRFGANIDRAGSAMAEAADGKLYVGGSFLNVKGDGYDHDFLIRLNADGSLDDSFRARIFSEAPSEPTLINSLYVAENESGVYFSGGNGSFQARYHFGKLDDSGALDQSIKTGHASGLNSIWHLAPGRRGELYLAGSLNNYDSVTVSGIVKIQVPVSVR